MTILAPFGLSVGMKLEDLGDLSPTEVAPFKFRIDKPPKAHPSFEFYVLEVTPVSGLAWIKAIGNEIRTNSFGTSVNSAFVEMEGKLKNIYGKCERIDVLLQGSIWTEPQDWMMGLIKGERLLCSNWEASTGANLTDAIESVFLGANGRDSDSGFISIEYTLKNHAAAAQEIAAAHDDAL